MSREQVTGARYEPDDYDEVEDYIEPEGYDDEHPDDEVEVQERRPAPRNRSRQAPRNMSRLPRPQDHKRKRPQVQREAEGDDTIDIEFRGATYTVAADQDDWTLEAMEAFEQNQMFAGVRALLGPRQWERFKARHNNRRAFREFLDEIADIFGFGDAGN